MEKKKTLYTYNPATDNFERFYPALADRLRQWGWTLMLSLCIGGGLFAIVYFGFTSHSERELMEENNRLRNRYEVLERRLGASMKVMEAIRKRDDNFYRVMLQMEPMSLTGRYAGLDYEKSYQAMQKMSDADLIARLTSEIDILDRRLYSQSQSFDEMRRVASSERHKMEHIPAIIPLRESGYDLSCGFGMRRDPVTGIRRSHTGIDFMAPEGTPVYATADGTIRTAHREAGSGNSIMISHGFNYATRYAHLSEILVEEGAEVKRGEIIGKVGSTGKSTLPHLHYEVIFKGEPQNPVNYFYLDLTPDSYTAMLQKADDAARLTD